MKVSYYIANKLSLGGDNGARISTSVVIAMCGVALSVLIMLLSIAIVLGFKQQIRSKVAGFESQISITASHNDDIGGMTADFDYLTYDSEMEAILSGLDLKQASLSIRQPAILKSDNEFEGVVLYGIDSGSDRMNFINENLTSDTLITSFGSNQIVVSKVTADALGVKVGEKIYSYFFVDGSVKARRMIIAAIYDSNFGDYDKIYAFSGLQMMQKLNGLTENQGTQIDINGIQPDNIDETAFGLQRQMMMKAYSGELHGTYQLSTVNQNAMLYLNWLDLLDTNVIVVLILMALVSGFTLISSLFIIILERVSTIGLLKALGATNKQTRQVFTVIGWRLVGWGMLIGNILALIIIFAQYFWHIIPLDATSYYLSYVPVLLDWLDILLLNVGVFIVSWAMLLIPARMVSNISPSRSLRYE
ncbi:MAG: ABC transporter permease [Muribaculum sp.]|nr:ABC transporter permease [Muribaculaceae bacterium]MCM1081031.1 ABC transporter permease [Muribaculum sp.]